jgi:hypothetical protein
LAEIYADRICKQPRRQTTMTRVINQQSAENMAYVRRLLGRRQPEFSAALEQALTLAEIELICPELSCDISAAEG